MTDQIFDLGIYNPPGGPAVPLIQALNKDGAPLAAAATVRYEWAVSQGICYSTIQTSATAALVARPTTLTGLELWNGNPAAPTGGVCMVVDRLFSQNLVSTAVNSGAAIWAQVTKPKAAPAGTALTINGAYGRPYGGLVTTDVGTTVVANGWFPWGPQYIAPSAAAPGGAWEASVDGRIIVPPQCSLCVTVVGSIAGDTYCSGAAWFERALILQ